MLKSTVPHVCSLQFLFKSTHKSWSYERNCEWVFSEHSVELKFAIASQLLLSRAPCLH